VIKLGVDVPEIVSARPQKRQTLLVSDTIPESVVKFLHDFMKSDFERIDCISADKSD
jgi:superfamily II DNA/RNA helicase